MCIQLSLDISPHRSADYTNYMYEIKKGDQRSRAPPTVFAKETTKETYQLRRCYDIQELVNRAHDIRLEALEEPRLQEILDHLKIQATELNP
eukprot:4464001-Amphidinium_carterae.2